MKNACRECQQGTCRHWCQWCFTHHPVASMVKDCQRKFKPDPTSA